MTHYLYPQNLKATANLWLWGLRDFTLPCILALLSAVLNDATDKNQDTLTILIIRDIFEKEVVLCSFLLA